MATPHETARPETPRPRRPRPATPWLFVATVLWFIALLAGGAALMPGADEGRTTWMAALLVVAAVAPASLLLSWRHATGAGDRIEPRLRELCRTLDGFVQEGGLSEGAKRVLHRRQERELLRRAIEQDIADHDWDAAMVLVHELADRFGYRADAEEFRARIERARAQTLDGEVVDAIEGLNELLRAARWDEAHAEVARIQRLYPESHRTDGLRERVISTRERYRQDLERRFLEAAGRQEIDSAMALLRELDQYLTPEEAGPFAEVARGVISKSRDNLGSRFKLLVRDHEWSAAIRVGHQIVEDFPNSRMATEVRELLPVLRERAGAAPSRAANGL